MKGTDVYDLGFSPEQTKQHGKPRTASEARYLSAVQTLAMREAEFFALDKFGAGASAKLEALQARHAAAVKVEQARREVINAAWTDGRLAETVHLGEVVRTMLAEICEKAHAPML